MNISNKESDFLSKYRLLDEGHQKIVETFIDKILAQDKDGSDARLSHAELIAYAIEIERQSDA